MTFRKSELLDRKAFFLEDRRFEVGYMFNRKDELMKLKGFWTKTKRC